LTKFYASESDISERIALLTDIGKELQSAGIIPDSVVFREARVTPMVRGYFLLNKAYKDWRIHATHHTEKPKIAALTCLVIARFQPFLPASPANVQTRAEARSNEVYALTYGLSVIEKSFTPDTPEKMDFWLRLVDIIAGSSVVTLEPYFQDIRLQIDRPLHQYTVAIQPQDKLAINSLISIFEMISAKGTDLLK
jgi:hypothetical protein